MKTRDFTADSQVQSLVAAFENASIAPAEFTHAAHIAVGVPYLAKEPLPAATQRRTL